MAFPLIPVIGGGIALAGLIKAARDSGRANDLSQQAIDLAKADYLQRAPLRDAFAQGALTPIASAPDLSAAFADPSNPFAGPVDLPQVGSQLDFSNVRFGDTTALDDITRETADYKEDPTEDPTRARDPVRDERRRRPTEDGDEQDESRDVLPDSDTSVRRARPPLPSWVEGPRSLTPDESAVVPPSFPPTGPMVQPPARAAAPPVPPPIPPELAELAARAAAPPAGPSPVAPLTPLQPPVRIPTTRRPAPTRSLGEGRLL